jgi:hypothetical protein
MSTVNATLLALAVFLTGAGVAVAEDVFIYPSKGQNPQQQEQDKYECHTWAKQQSGFDPTNPPPASTATPSPQSGSAGGAVARGAVIGGVGGAVVGGIASDDAGKGAAIGAVSGGLIGGMRRRQQQQRQQQAYQQEQAQQLAEIDAMRASYNRAFSACLEGRGYTVR